ncbi:MAG TPA: 2Fe-2S iron-sulfur cluster-binding protein [Actinomycetales bacterium]|jgi:2Fe-2S ferredoxin|nr:2Fe-2S iron-sulfur cluster-binding protein [Actinomycetales bacterium]
MGKASFTLTTGEVRVVDVPDGWSLMEGARQEGIEGVVAECGGGMICGTCHVKVDPRWFPLTGDQEVTEEALLKVVPEREETSRLSCQVLMSPELDGIEVSVPSEQLDM